MTRGRSTVMGFGFGGFTGFGSRRLLERSMRLHLTRQLPPASQPRPHQSCASGREPEHVDEARSRLDLDQAEMVEQLQRRRDRLPSDVMIQPEVGVAHARAAAVADGRSIAANTRRALRGSIAKAGEFSRSVIIASSLKGCPTRAMLDSPPTWCC